MKKIAISYFTFVSCPEFVLAFCLPTFTGTFFAMYIFV